MGFARPARGGLLLAACLLAPAGRGVAAQTAADGLSAQPPLVAVAGLPAPVTVTVPGQAPEGQPVAVEIVDETGRVLVRETLAPGQHTLRVTLKAGTHRLEARQPGAAAAAAFTLRAVAGWTTLVPPLLAIALALLLRQVVPALLAGIWIGAAIGYGGPFTGFLRTLDAYLVGVLVDRDHIEIILFSMLLGGMVGIVTRAGGMAGLVDVLSRHATDSRRGQCLTWLLGLAIFFDDYANTLVVGNTMRPVTDRLRISREKLAYIVDSTAAPVAAIALISTWIGFEVSLIGDALEVLGTSEDPYWLFLQAIPHLFYPIFAVLLVVYVALGGRDLGPMWRAECRAAAGKLVADGAAPLADFDTVSLAPVEGKPRRWWNAGLPVLAVLVVTFVSQFLTGRASLAAEGDPLGTASLTGLGFRGFGRAFSAGNSFDSLLYGAVCGCLAALVLAWAQRILRLAEGLQALVDGMKTMFLAFVILTLAWAIGKVCADLRTADYVVSVLTGNLDPRLLPGLVFALAAAISFATGSSWSTMSILVPLAVPAAYRLAEGTHLDAARAYDLLLGAIASVLGGSVFGDHCSPISDTTVMSSMAAACDHVDHVRTQLPYALLAALVALVVGHLPAGYGVPTWVSLVTGAALLWLGLRALGRPARDRTAENAPRPGS